MDATPPQESTRRYEISPRHLLYTLVGWALQAVFGVLALASGLVAPPPAAALIIGIWVASAAYSMMRWRRSMWIPLGMSLIAVTAFLVIVGLGGIFFGWSA